MDDKTEQFRKIALGQGFNEQEINDFLAMAQVFRGRAGTSESGEVMGEMGGYNAMQDQRVGGPTPAPVPTPTPSGGVFDLIRKYFPQEEWDRAYNVMKGESGGNPGAVGDDYPIRGLHAPSYGLFQIRGLPGRPAKEQLLDPEFNTRYAADMWKNQGWGPWTAARKLGYAR